MSEEIISNKKNHPEKIKEQETEENEMSFWEHLEALRSHLVRSLIAILIFAILAFLNRTFVFDVIILAPKSTDFITNELLCRFSEWINYDFLCMKGGDDLKLINVKLSGQFLTHMYISFMFGLIASIPYVFWELWRFVKPALYENEQKNSTGAVGVTSILFILGVLFAYFLIVPLAVYFLGGYQVSDQIENTITLSSYISTVMTLSLALGLVFELPVVMHFLARVGVVSADFLKSNRKYMVVVALILAAIITPADVFSQLMVSVPLLILYEVSIKVVKRVERKRAAAENEE